MACFLGVRSYEQVTAVIQFAVRSRCRRTGLSEQYDLVDMTVLVGDLNAEPDSAELTPIRDVYSDVLIHLDPLPTYPSWAPDQRIDHVFASKGLSGFDSQTFGGLASDHLRVAVTLIPAPAGEGE